MRENDHSCHIGKYGIGMRRKVLYGFFVCAATLGIVGLTVSAEKNIAVDGSHISVALWGCLEVAHILSIITCSLQCWKNSSRVLQNPR